MPAAVHILFLGSLIFQPSAKFSDLALECAIPANAKANPVPMPTAAAYLMSGRDGRWLEDRFNVFELWRADAIRARWTDADGSAFTLCRIPRMVPDAGGDPRTRRDFVQRLSGAVIGRKDLEALDEAVYLLAPVSVTQRFAPRRALRQNLAALWQYATTNENAFVYAFRPRTEGRIQADWYMVSLVSDDLDAADKIDDWLDGVDWLKPPPKPTASRKPPPTPPETALLAEDYRRNVVNYEDWHFAMASNIVVVDNMQDIDRRPFLNALTNVFPRMQATYRAVLPSPLKDNSHIAAVRIFATREEYLDYVGWDMRWSAALWSPKHRELVLYYPRGGSEMLLNTVWHEALHQHLDYACSMIQTQPWFNEGHAELFEHVHFDMDDNIVFDLDVDAVQAIQQNAAELAPTLPLLLDMDYPEFYAGTAEERQMKYHLAWSLAYFLQVGAPNVRFQPFKNLRADLMSATVRTGNRAEAQRAVMDDVMRKTLVEEWTSFWKHL